MFHTFGISMTREDYKFVCYTYKCMACNIKDDMVRVGDARMIDYRQ